MSKEQPQKLEPSFSSLVMSIAASAIIKLGLDPESKEEKNLPLARYNIDLLEILQEKTKNNLTKEESDLIDNCVKDLKLQAIQISNKN